MAVNIQSRNDVKIRQPPEEFIRPVVIVKDIMFKRLCYSGAQQISKGQQEGHPVTEQQRTNGQACDEPSISQPGQVIHDRIQKGMVKGGKKEMYFRFIGIDQYQGSYNQEGEERKVKSPVCCELSEHQEQERGSGTEHMFKIGDLLVPQKPGSGKI